MSQETLNPTGRPKSKNLNLISVTSAQLRAARALLDLSRSDCARLTGLSPETIKNIEHDIFAPTQDTIEKIINAFSCHGVEFFTQHGVALKEGLQPKASEASATQ